MFCRSPKHTQTGAPFHNASHLPPLDVIGSILGVAFQAAADLGNKGLRQPWADTIGGSGGADRGCEGCLGHDEGAEDETNNSKFAKRTWNVPWNQHFHFLAFHFSIADSERGRAWSLLDRGRRRRAESQPTLTAKDLNELRTLSC